MTMTTIGITTTRTTITLANTTAITTERAKPTKTPMKMKLAMTTTMTISTPMAYTTIAVSRGLRMAMAIMTTNIMMTMMKPKYG